MQDASFAAQNAPKNFWRPGYARTRWGGGSAVPRISSRIWPPGIGTFPHTPLALLVYGTLQQGGGGRGQGRMGREYTQYRQEEGLEHLL